MPQRDDPLIFTLALSPVPSACFAARRLAEDALTFWGFDDEAIEDGKLVVDELVTNSVQHATASQDITLRIFIGDNSLPIVEVWDDVDEKPAPREADFVAEDGRGLFLVESFSERWGANPVAGGGKVVWAELSAGPQASNAAS